MMHSAIDQATHAAPAGREALTPGGYMLACRQRANLSRAEVAEKLALAHHDRQFALRDLLRLESDQPGDYLRLVSMLRDHRVFAFSFDTFTLLAAATTDPEADPVKTDWAA